MISRLSHAAAQHRRMTRYLEDADIEFRQALEMATIHSNILVGMMDAFASVVSNNST